MNKRTLESAFDFGDKVDVQLNATTLEGTIVGISFSESKVFYDVDTEKALLIRMDSALIVEYPKPKIPKYDKQS